MYEEGEKMKWINLAYAAGKSVSVREDFKLIRIGGDFQGVSQLNSSLLMQCDYSNLTAMCVKVFNEERLFDMDDCDDLY